MGPGNYKPRHNNYQPLRDQEQKTERETTEQAAAENGNIEPHRNDRSLERSPGADGADMVTINTYGNWQVRVSHAQRMEREASEAPSQERTPARQLIEQDAAAGQEAAQHRTPARELIENSASESRTAETEVDPSRSNEIER